jgi:hypothetical protein
VYQTARAALEAAVGGLSRHPALRVRVVRGPDGVLAFAAAAGQPPISWIEVEDAAGA